MFYFGNFFANHTSHYSGCNSYYIICIRSNSRRAVDYNRLTTLLQDDNIYKNYRLINMLLLEKGNRG